MKKYKEIAAECKKKLKNIKVLVHGIPNYKSSAEKKLAKLEALYEKTPKECKLKRARILKAANNLAERRAK